MILTSTSGPTRAQEYTITQVTKVSREKPGVRGASELRVYTVFERRIVLEEKRGLQRGLHHSRHRFGFTGSGAVSRRIDSTTASDRVIRL